MTKGAEFMEIKQFNVISYPQKKELYNFIRSRDMTYNKTYVEMTKIYESDTFNEGKTIFIVFHKGKIKGSVALITKEISISGEAYITDIYIAGESVSNEDAYKNGKLTDLNAEILFHFLIQEVVDYSNICGATSIKIGIRESETHLISHIVKLEFDHIYDAVIMKYDVDKNSVLKCNKDIELKSLSILNCQEYMDIQNQAFKNSPNGATIDELEVRDYIVQYANNEDMIGLCFAENKPCGIYELSTNENIGWIDILAVAPICQNKGIGQVLIIKCIQRLWEKGVEGIKLLVITSNEIAIKLYKENGFKEEKVFSYWFQKKM